MQIYEKSNWTVTNYVVIYMVYNGGILVQKCF